MQKQPPKQRVAQADTKMAPPAKFDNCVLKSSEILEKIKTELKIESFLSLANYLEKLYKNIVAQKDIARNTLSFMDGITKIPHNKS